MNDISKQIQTTLQANQEKKKGRHLRLPNHSGQKQVLFKSLWETWQREGPSSSRGRGSSLLSPQAGGHSLLPNVSRTLRYKDSNRDYQQHSTAKKGSTIRLFSVPTIHEKAINRHTSKTQVLSQISWDNFSFM